MATKEMMTLSGAKFPCFNVSLPVGVGGSNAVDDVMLIQAMFRFIAERFGELSTLGITSRNDLSGLTGVLDKKTINVITRYQSRWARILLATNGLIHPANYANRDLNLDGTTRRMTITLLHQHCQDAAARSGETDYTTAMIHVSSIERFY